MLCSPLELSDFKIQTNKQRKRNVSKIYFRIHTRYCSLLPYSVLGVFPGMQVGDNLLCSHCKFWSRNLPHTGSIHIKLHSILRMLRCSLSSTEEGCSTLLSRFLKPRSVTLIKLYSAIPKRFNGQWYFFHVSQTLWADVSSPRICSTHKTKA